MRFKTFLSERKQAGSLYHFTDIYNIETILKSNSLQSLNNLQNKKLGKVISTTRNKKGMSLRGKGDDKSFYGSTRIELDGDKLSDKYKIKPVDFQGDLDNYEEAIFTDKVNDLYKYIKSVTFIQNKRKRKNEEILKVYQDIKDKFNNIKIELQ
jgi:hypothetical protein